MTEKIDRRFRPRRDYRNMNPRTREALLLLARGQKAGVVAIKCGLSKQWVNELQNRLREGFYNFPKI